jgi:hypothetical protein
VKLFMLTSKIHRARLTGARLDYEGSIAVDADLLHAADMLPGEQVHGVADCGAHHGVPVPGCMGALLHQRHRLSAVACEEEAIKMTSDCTAHRPSPWRRLIRPLGQFLAWWFGMFALLGPLSTCPFCGQPGCGGSVAGAGILGALAAGLLWLPRRLLRLFRRHRSLHEDRAR